MKLYLYNYKNRSFNFKIYDSIDRLHLFIAATYNVSVISYSDDFGEGGTSYIQATTEIGIPDPSPPLPNVLYSNEKTITIEIPPLMNENGPISLIQVVVVLVDSELSQRFDETLLKGYKEAIEDGTNYYITAELPNEVLKFHTSLEFWQKMPGLF